MTKSTTQVAAAQIDTGTAPAFVPTDKHVVEVINAARRRPVLAINAAGDLIVCCRRTARKHGWKVEGALFTRVRSSVSATQTPAITKKATKLVLDATTGAMKVATKATKSNITAAAATAGLPADILALLK